MNDNALLILVVLGILVVTILLVFFVSLRKRKNKAFLARGMNLALFLVTLPQELDQQEQEKRVPIAEYLKLAEQFYSSLTAIVEKGFFSRLLLGNPYFVFEIAVHRIGEEIYFYFACPRSFAQMMEKQIQGFWPKSHVQPIEDYNVFNPSGFSVGSRAMLAKSFMLPIKAYEDFQVDPLSSITSVLTKLEKEGEGATVQFLVRRSRKKLHRKATKAAEFLQQGLKPEAAVAMAQGGVIRQVNEVLLPQTKDEREKGAQKKEITPVQQEMIQKISKKVSQPIFDVNIRMLASASQETRAQTILSQLESAFEQFNSPILNQIKFKKISGKDLKKLFYRFSFRIFSDQETMVFSSGELAGLFHFPSSTLRTPRIKWLKAEQAPPPTNLPTQGLVVGKSVFRGEEKVVRILDDDRRRHFYLIGQTGTGKSALLQEMIRQDIEAGKGVALIDPHGDLAERVLGFVPPSRAEDVIYLNPSDMDRPVGLNMLEYDPRFPEAKTMVVNELIEIFEKLYNLKAQGFGGPVFEQYMRNSLLLVMEDPQSGSTLIEVPRVLADPSFRKYKLSRCKNLVVKNFWELEAEKAGGEAALANMVPYITSKMNIFIANDLVRPIISQQHSSFNFRDIMDNGKIFIVNLSKGRLGDINSYLLGMIVIGKILISALSRADIPEDQRRDFYLYIDEFHNVTTKTISSILAEARKYRLNMVFGHQFIGQLDEETRKAVFGNVGSMLAFRVGPDDAKYLVTEFAPVFNEKDLVNFDNYNAALRLLVKGESSKPFNIVTYPPAPGSMEVAGLIKELSRAKYGRDRTLVESELYERLQKGFFSISPSSPQI